MIYKELLRLQQAKKAIKEAIERSGTPVDPTLRLDEYAQLIGGGSEWHCDNPICVENIGDTDVALTVYTKNAPAGIEYSYDKVSWTKVEETSLGYTSVMLRLTNPRIYFRARYIVTNSSDQLFAAAASAKLRMSGNLASLNEAGDGVLVSPVGYLWTTDNGCLTEVKDLVLPQCKANTKASFEALFIRCKGLTKVGDITYNYDVNISSIFANMFSQCTALTEIGDITINGSINGSSTFNSTFSGCTSLVNPPKITITGTTITGSLIYSFLFSGCSKLSRCAEFDHIPIRKISCSRMYQGCIALTEGKLPPTESLDSNGYSYMFDGCTSLTTAPSLPATTLASSCYSYMFHGCTSLVEAPSLPATTLVSSCYSYMFDGCTSLAEAPSLPATKLVSSCYYYMFRFCRNVDKIEVYAAAWSNQTNWVSGVAASGEFHKKAGVSIPTGINGIPSGWTVIEDLE